MFVTLTVIKTCLVLHYKSLFLLGPIMDKLCQTFQLLEDTIWQMKVKQRKYYFKLTFNNKPQWNSN